MRWFLIAALATGLALIACEEAVEFEVVEHDPVGLVVQAAPMPSSTRARVQREPSRASEVCKKACKKVNGELFRVGPDDSKYGWECLCSWKD